RSAALGARVQHALLGDHRAAHDGDLVLLLRPQLRATAPELGCSRTQATAWWERRRTARLPPRLRTAVAMATSSMYGCAPRAPPLVRSGMPRRYAWRRPLSVQLSGPPSSWRRGFSPGTRKSGQGGPSRARRRASV